MKHLLKVCVLTLACALAFGCGHKQKQAAPSGEFVEEFTQSRFYGGANSQQERYRELLPIHMERKYSARLMRRAHSALGTPYVRGGVDPSGFDCSGFVQWTYKSVGIKLPRTAREQSVVGQHINNIEDMVAGDIVTFRHPKRGYHTGIYVGDGKFIHSPRMRTRVRINALSDAYFSSTFTGARRVALNGSENLLVQAERRLAEESISRGNVIKSRAVKHVKQGKGHKELRLLASKDKKATRNKNQKLRSNDNKTSQNKNGKLRLVVSSDKKAPSNKIQSGKSSGKVNNAPNVTPRKEKKVLRVSVQASRVEKKGKRQGVAHDKRNKARTSASNMNKKTTKSSTRRG